MLGAVPRSAIMIKKILSFFSRPASSRPLKPEVVNKPIWYLNLPNYADNVPIVWFTTPSPWWDDKSQNEPLIVKYYSGHNEISIPTFIDMARKLGIIKIDIFTDSWTSNYDIAVKKACLPAAINAKEELEKYGFSLSEVNGYLDLENKHEISMPLAKDILNVMGAKIEENNKYWFGFSAAPIASEFQWLKPSSFDRKRGTVVTYNWEDIKDDGVGGDDRLEKEIMDEINKIISEGGEVILIFRTNSPRDLDLIKRLNNYSGVVGFLGWTPTSAGGI